MVSSHPRASQKCHHAGDIFDPLDTWLWCIGAQAALIKRQDYIATTQSKNIPTPQAHLTPPRYCEGGRGLQGPTPRCEVQLTFFLVVAMFAFARSSQPMAEQTPGCSRGERKRFVPLQTSRTVAGYELQRRCFGSLLQVWVVSARSARPPRTARSSGPGDGVSRVPAQETACMHAHHRVCETASPLDPFRRRYADREQGSTVLAFADACTATTASWLTLSPRQ